MKKILSLLLVMAICTSLIQPSTVKALEKEEAVLEETSTSEETSLDEFNPPKELVVLQEDYYPSKARAVTIYQITDTITATLENGTLKIEGTGEMPNYDYGSDSPWYQNTEIMKIEISEGITSIGDNNFTYLMLLSEIVLPNTLTTIGKAAFYGCFSLETIEIPSSVIEIKSGAFANCYELQDVILNEGLQIISDYAFQYTPITTIDLPSTVNSFGNLAFYKGRLDSYNVSEKNETYCSVDGVLYSKDQKVLVHYPSEKMDTSYTILDGVETIRENAFYLNSYITNVDIPSSVTSIGDWAFAYTPISEINIPSSVTNLGNGICDTCTSLVKANVKATIDTLTYRTFYGCSALTDVILGDSIQTIDSRAFMECTSLNNVDLPNQLVTIKVASFYGCTSLIELDIPSSVQLIEADAFSNCPNIDLKLPSHLELIENGSYMAVEKIQIDGTYYYDQAKEILKIVNEQRVANGLNPLIMNEELFNAAQIRAAELAILYSHTRPIDLRCFTVCSLAQGENIAAGYTSANAVMNGWMNSSGHRANILNTNFQSIGIGCFVHNGSYYWVQLFSITDGEELIEYPNNQSTTASIKCKINSIDYLLNHKTLSLSENEKETLYMYGKNAGCNVNFFVNSESLTWISSDTNVATVSNGVVTAKNAGTCTITAKVNNERTVSCTVTVKYPNPYDDVAEGKWYTEPILRAAALGIMTGKTDTHFGTTDPLSRAAMATVLYRLAGEPSVEGEQPSNEVFPDVSNTWYTKAITWAYTSEIVTGHGNGTFKPNDGVTRQQLALMLYRYAKEILGEDVSVGTIDFSQFSDGNEVASWASEAMQWAIDNGIISGNDNGTLNPKGTVSRAQCAVMMMRFYDQFIE